MLLVPTQFPHIQASASELNEMDALILPMHLALLATSVLLKASVVDAFLPDTQIAKCSIVQGKIPTAVKRWADHKSDNEVGNVNSKIVGENDGVTISDNKSAGTRQRQLGETQACAKVPQVNNPSCTYNKH